MLLLSSDSSTRGYQPHPEDQDPGDKASKPNSIPHWDAGQPQPATPSGPAWLLHRAVSDHCCRSLPAVSQHSGLCCTLLQKGQAPAWCPQALQSPAECHQRPGSYSGGGDHVTTDEAALRPGPGLQGGGRFLAPPRHGAEDCLPAGLHSSHEALTWWHPTHDAKHHNHDPQHHGQAHLASLFQHLSRKWAE